ncbi:hypothetical protein CEXT_628211 [Caerostris extrusa]|uniref:Uncharacterized protein n=1 Tax=Caerostris extrusa TaxID=172846 RepID=A0AAV4VN07_CAEEX|nr:hypothetical protein CEXT_628211 [Caerostris extrusa]
MSSPAKGKLKNGEETRKCKNSSGEAYRNPGFNYVVAPMLIRRLSFYGSCCPATRKRHLSVTQKKRRSISASKMQICPPRMPAAVCICPMQR